MRVNLTSNPLVAASALAVLLAAGIGAAATLLHPAVVSANIAALAEAEAVDDARDLEWLAQLDALGALDDEVLAQFAAPANEPIFNEMARLDELLIDDDGVVTSQGEAARERARLHVARASVLAARRTGRCSTRFARGTRSAELSQRDRSSRASTSIDRRERRTPRPWTRFDRAHGICTKRHRRNNGRRTNITNAQMRYGRRARSA